MSARILVVDDEASLRDVLRIVLEGEGYQVTLASTYKEATRELSHRTFDLVICDIVLPDGNGLDLLRAQHKARPETPFAMITAHSTPAHMITSLREGAVEYLSKPFDVDDLKLIVAKQITRKAEKPTWPSFHQFVGESPVMWPILERIPQIARADSAVLITGESGTGKELLARAIHTESARASRPFVPVNCAALPESLLESELFGHVKGSFTGAVRDKRGLFQEAEGGVLFLDEIGEMNPPTQAKLLRALQDKRIRPVGDTREVPVDVRLITATNQDLLRLVKEGRFREDLYYRVHVLHVHLPPLRERQEDIPVLARVFVERACARLGVPVKEISSDVMLMLQNYPWRGNVRELENVMEQAVAMEASSLLSIGSLPPSVVGGLAGRESTEAWLVLPEEGLDLDAHLAAIRRELMQKALARFGGVSKRGAQKKAARLLRMSYRTFRDQAARFKLLSEE
ncbi:MAG TPA: sigma-54 dependent transcriptional regulator [Solirubrobacteraceae bacterium]|nr:sigma-54 dependent transcriptional regulator [Solirubrobacteraceae bacterium]